jgi:hypothetical protein
MDSSRKDAKQPLIATGASDPFWTIKDVLEGEIRSLRIKFDEWKASLNTVNTATDVRFKVNHEGVFPVFLWDCKTV